VSLALDQLRIEDLSISDRVDLIGLLWDSITDEEAVGAAPEWHRRELERRRAAAETDPGAGSSWEEVRARLLGGS
jgi:putative addiction module component (TIGR02574 family)